MILSFHPCYIADQNRLCAGRDPNEEDIDAMRAARAVVLPQGCRAALYHAARRSCAHVFPNYDVRFAYPGKIGQIKLFRKQGALHPRSWLFNSLAHYHRVRAGRNAPPPAFPLVFKFDWGGEGQTVFRIAAQADLQAALDRAQVYESTGQYGFLLQEHLATGHRTLRVVVIGEQAESYWRIQACQDRFGANLAQDATLDHQAAPSLRASGIDAVRALCHQTGINLAGFDLLFDGYQENASPLLLEINYYFGRKGLGGSNRYYALLGQEIDRWLARIKLPAP